jgi:hypothetical protein
VALRVIDLTVTHRSRDRAGLASAAGEVKVTDLPTASAEGAEASGRPFSELNPEQQRRLVRRWLEAERPTW